MRMMRIQGLVPPKGKGKMQKLMQLVQNLAHMNVGCKQGKSNHLCILLSLI